MAKKKLMLVRWNDSTQSNGWIYKDQVDPVHTIESIGWVEKKNGFVVVTSHRDTDTGYHCGDMAIPEGCILSMERVVKKRRD